MIILLVRALANAINKEIWRAFLDSKIDYELSLKKTKGKKQNKIIAALDQAGKSASTQIAEQVDAHLKGARKRSGKTDQKQSSKKQRPKKKPSSKAATIY